MEKNIKLYKQHGNTCGIACMLMILEYYGIIKANKYYEKKYYNIYKSHFLDGVPFSAIAYHLVKQNLVVSIFHSEKYLFKKNDYLDSSMFESLINEYKMFLKSAKEKNLKIVNRIEIDCNLLKEKLDDNNFIILAGQIDNNLHAILLSGYIDNNFIVYDPLESNKQIKSFNEINTFMNTSIGKWFITVKEKGVG